jgi:hypothetical protein
MTNEATPTPTPQEETELRRTREEGESAAEPSKSVPRPSNVNKPAFVRVGAGGSDETIDFGTAVLPALLRTYAPRLLAGAVLIVVAVLVTKRRRR